MAITTIKKHSGVAMLMAVGLVVPIAYSQTTPPPTKPDNSAVNKRDQNPGEATADQQKMNPQDRELTAKIRKSIMADKSLSTYAHNVKIISQDGVVTLKGPVRSQDEIDTIVAKAKDATSSGDKVVNQLTVAPPKPKTNN